MRLSTICSILDAVGAELTGSRYFNKKAPNLVTINLNTDWDYVINEARFTKDLRDDLISIGFSSRASYDYTTKTGTVEVLSIDTDDGVKVDLIVKQNYYSYIHVFENMTPEYYVCYIWKRGGHVNPEDIENNLCQLL